LPVRYVLCDSNTRAALSGGGTDESRIHKRNDAAGCVPSIFTTQHFGFPFRSLDRASRRFMGSADSVRLIAESGEHQAALLRCVCLRSAHLLLVAFIFLETATLVCMYIRVI
jgi:hypothetical protein